MWEALKFLSQNTHPVNQISRQHISFTSNHIPTQVLSFSPIEALSISRQIMSPFLSIFGKWYYLCWLECPISPESSSAQLKIQYRVELNLFSSIFHSSLAVFFTEHFLSSL